jgi:putative flippase GtrA
MCELITPGYTALDYALVGGLTFAVAAATHVLAYRAQAVAQRLQLARAPAC